MASALKRCFKCLQEKDLSAFYKHPQMADGRLSKCIECTKADVRRNYRSNRDHYVSYYKARQQTPARKAFNQASNRRRRAAAPEKYKARGAVARAIRNGTLVRQPCARCGATSDVQAHHHDYSKPLDIEWLCRTCHFAEHGIGLDRVA